MGCPIWLDGYDECWNTPVISVFNDINHDNDPTNNSSLECWYLLNLLEAEKTLTKEGK